MNLSCTKKRQKRWSKISEQKGLQTHKRQVWLGGERHGEVWKFVEKFITMTPQNLFLRPHFANDQHTSSGICVIRLVDPASKLNVEKQSQLMI
mmetsp:Transcript_6590/g.24680  ORF Transcript_6590/g.24680 Transcript_6590/m.24680 type:complete len:93 (+) Transcript_6590:1056-1334(+)